MGSVDIYKTKSKAKKPIEKYTIYPEGDISEVTFLISNYRNLKKLAEGINDYLIRNDSSIRKSNALDISYKKPFNLMIGREDIYIAKNLNLLEKLIFEHHLRNFQKKNNSKKD